MCLELLRLSDPVHISLQVLLHLLLRAQTLEISAGLSLLLLFGELSGERWKIVKKKVKGRKLSSYPLRTPRMRFITKKAPRTTMDTK